MLASPAQSSYLLLLTHGPCSRTGHAPPRHALRRHQALALAADLKQWPAAALAKKFKADAGSLERAIEYCSSYVVVHSSAGAAYAQKRPPPGAAGAVLSELRNDPLSLPENTKRTRPPTTFKAEI